MRDLKVLLMFGRSQSGTTTVGEMRRENPPSGVSYYEMPLQTLSGRGFLDRLMYRPLKLTFDKYLQVLSPLALAGAFSNVDLGSITDVDLVHSVHYRGLSRYNQPYVLEVDQPITDWLTRYESIPEGKLFLLTRLVRRILRNPNFKGIITWSETARSRIFSHYGLREDQVKVVPPPVPIVPPTAPRDGIRILFVGYDFWRKGGDLVLTAYQKLCEASRQRIELTYVGPIPSEYHPLLSTGVDHFPSVPHSTLVHELMPTCDIFVLPSRVDCYPITLLEAMSSGLAPVVTSEYAIPEIISDGVNGFLIHQPAVAGLLEIVSLLLDDESLREEIGRRASETVRSRFHPDVVAGQLRSAYDTFLGG